MLSLFYFSWKVLYR